MKVLLVSEPGENGVFRQVEDLADYLIAAGHTVSLAYSDVRSSDRLFALLKRIQEASGYTVNLRVVNQPQLGDMHALWQLGRLYSRFRPDVIHAHSAKAGALVRILRRLGSRTPAFYTPHAYYGMGRPPSPLNSFFTYVERFLGSSAMTLNTSADEADFAINTLHAPSRLQRTVQNGVDTQHFTPCLPHEKKKLRAEFGIPDDAVVLGTLGRFSYQKDPATLHQAFRACADLKPNLHLIHVGAGELRGNVQAYAKTHGYNQRVTWIEYLRDPAPFYRMLDGFILTSRYEGLSLAVLEALAVDVPILLSDAPGNRGFSSLDFSHHWTARIQSPESFASAITSWYADRSHHRPCNHRALTIQHFSRQRQFQHIQELYSLALTGASSTAGPAKVKAPLSVP